MFTIDKHQRWERKRERERGKLRERENRENSRVSLRSSLFFVTLRALSSSKSIEISAFPLFFLMRVKEKSSIEVVRFFYVLLSFTPPLKHFSFTLSLTLDSDSLKNTREKISVIFFFCITLKSKLHMTLNNIIDIELVFTFLALFHLQLNIFLLHFFKLFIICFYKNYWVMKIGQAEWNLWIVAKNNKYFCTFSRNLLQKEMSSFDHSLVGINFINFNSCFQFIKLSN